MNRVRRELGFWLPIGTIVVGTILFLAMILAPGLGIAERLGGVIGTLGRLFEPSASVGRYALPLNDGETASAVDLPTLEMLLAERGAGAPAVGTLVEGEPTCIQVLGRSAADGLLVMCAPAQSGHPEIDAAAEMPPEAGLVFIDLIRAQQARLSADEVVQASWIDETPELAEHRGILLSDGYAVGTGIVPATFGDRSLMGTILQWSGGAEWIGYLWVAGDTYLAWGWAPDRNALDAILTR